MLHTDVSAEMSEQKVTSEHLRATGPASGKGAVSVRSSGLAPSPSESAAPVAAVLSGSRGLAGQLSFVLGGSPWPSLAMGVLTSVPAPGLKPPGSWSRDGRHGRGDPPVRVPRGGRSGNALSRHPLPSLRRRDTKPRPACLCRGGRCSGSSS